MRTVLKTIATIGFLTGSLAMIAGGRRLLLVVAANHHHTFFQYLLFTLITAGGLLGCVSALLLMRLRTSGRRTSVPYLILVAIYCFIADLGSLGAAGLVFAIAAVGCLLTPAARTLCTTRPPRTTAHAR
jgi:hypothetical protein